MTTGSDFQEQNPETKFSTGEGAPYKPPRVPGSRNVWFNVNEGAEVGSDGRPLWAGEGQAPAAETRWHTQATTSYWQDLARVARYHIALDKKKPEEAPPSVDMRNLQIAYDYYKFMNNDKPYYQWDPKKIPGDDPMMGFIGQMSPPDKSLMHPGEYKYLPSEQNVGQYLDPMQKDLDLTMGQVAMGLFKYGLPPKVITDWMLTGEVPAQHLAGFQEAGVPADDRAWWQKLVTSALTKPGRMGATIGFAVGGGVGGAAVGFGLGTAAGKSEKVANLLLVLDYAWQGLERVITVAGLSSHMAGKRLAEGEGWKGIVEGYKEAFSDPKALWQAAQFGAEAAHIGALWGKDKRTHKFDDDWTVGSEGRMVPWGPGSEAELGYDALTKIRDELVAGASMEETYEKWMYNFGVEGLTKEIVGGIFLDPLNWMFPQMAATEIGQNIAKVVGGQQMLKAVQIEKGRPLSVIKTYGTFLRDNYAPGGVGKAVSEMSAIDRTLAGIAIEGHWLDDTRMKLSNMEANKQFRHAVDDLVSINEAAKITEQKIDIYSKVENGKDLTPQEIELMGEHIANKAINDEHLTDVEIQYITNHRDYYEIALNRKKHVETVEVADYVPPTKPISEAKTPQEYIDIRMSSKGDPTKFGRVAGAVTAGGIAGVIGSAIFGPVIGIPFGALLFGGIGFKKGLSQLITLTPEARAAKLANSVGVNIGTMLDELRGMDDVDLAVDLAISRIRGVMETPTEIAEALSIATLKTPEGKILPKVLAGMEEKLGAHRTAWERGKWANEVKNTMGMVLDMNPEDVLKGISTKTGAEELLKMFTRKLQGVEDPGAKAILQAIDEGILTPDNLVNMSKRFIEGGIATSLEQWIKQLEEMVGIHAAGFAVDWFGVKPDVFTNRFFNTIKSVNSLLLLGMNPMYAVNNAIGDAVSAIAEGVFRLEGREKALGFWKRFGIEPPSLKSGQGAAGEHTFRTGAGAEVIRSATRVDDGLQKFQDVVRGTQDKIGFASKLAAVSEKFSSLMVMTSAMKQFWGRVWRPGIGFDDVPQHLQDMLNTIDPGLVPQVREAITMGINAKEITDGLKAGVNRLGIDHFLETVAPRFAKTPQDAAGMFHHIGAYDFLQERLRLAETNAEVRTAFSDFFSHVDNELFKYAEDSSDVKRNMIKQEIAVEGAQAAIMRLNKEIYIDEAAQRIADFADWGRVFDMREKVKTGEISHSDFKEAMTRQRKQSEIRYKRSFSRWRTEMLGITEGLGLDNIHSRRIIAEMIGIERTWSDFYSKKHADIDRLLKTFFETPEQSNAAWKAMREDHSRLYSKTLSEEGLMKLHQDRVFVDMISEKYGEGARNVTQKIFDDVATLREEMGMTMRNFIDSLNKDIPQKQKDLMWVEFREETVYPMWVAKMNAALEGMDEVYKVINDQLLGKVEDQKSPEPTGPDKSGLVPEPGKPGAKGADEITTDVPKVEEAPVQREIYGKPEEGAEPVVSGPPSTRPGAARQKASEHGYATADAEGNYLPGADVHLLNIVKKYHPDQARVNKYESLNDLVDPAKEVGLAFDERAKIKKAIADNQKRVDDAQQKMFKDKADAEAKVLEDIEAGIEPDLLHMTDEQIRDHYKITDAEIEKAVPFDDMDARSQAVIDLQNRTKVVEVAQMDRLKPGNLQRYKEHGVSWDGMEKLADEMYYGFDQYPKDIELQLQATARQLRSMLRDSGKDMRIDTLGRDLQGGLPVDIERALDLMFDPEASRFDKYRVRYFSDPIWKEFRAENPTINKGTLDNILTRFIEGDYKRVKETSVTEPLLHSMIVDQLIGGTVEDGTAMNMMMMKRGNPGLLYIQGEEARAARAVQYHFFERVKDGTWRDADINELAGTVEIFDHLMKAYDDLPANEKLPEHAEMVRMDLADDVPNPESIRIEQDDLITQTQTHQMDQVKQQEEMLNRIDEYRHLSNNPQSTETKYIREAFIRDQQAIYGRTPDQADFMAQAYDAQARIWSGRTGKPQAEFWDKIYGFAKGMGDSDDVLHANYYDRQPIDAGRVKTARNLYRHYSDIFKGDWVSKAKEIFGETHDPAEAGYIMDDGAMLDFSGKNEGGSAGNRQYDHNDINQIWEDADMAVELEDLDIMETDWMAQSNYEDLKIFTFHTESIRMDLSRNYQRHISQLNLDMSQPMTNGQMRTIMEIISSEGVNEIYFDFTDRNGNQITQGKIVDVLDSDIRDLKMLGKQIYDGIQGPEFIRKPERFYQGGDKTNPIWYSKLDRWVDDLPMDNMQVEQFQGMLKKAGITKDELYWTGMGDWADMLKPGEMISKQDIQDYVQKNKVEISETIYSQAGKNDQVHYERIQWQEKLGHANDAIKRVIDDIVDRIPEDVIQELDAEGFVVKETATRLAVERTLQGGASTQGIEQNVLRADYDLYNEYSSNLNEATSRIQALDSEIHAMEGNTQYIRYTLGEGEGSIDYKEFLLKFDNDMVGRGHMDRAEFDLWWKDYAERSGLNRASTDYDYRTYVGNRNLASNLPYQHPHWSGQDNVAAHGRATTRLNSEGGLAFNIEEIQSDLHQAGRTKGYQRRMSDVDAIEKPYIERSLPPEAPWSKSWDELVAKRLIRQAVESGADEITWTTGKQQADRYPLQYRWEPLDTHDINVIGNGSHVNPGYTVIDKIIIDLDLSGVIGNEGVILKEFLHLFPDAHMGDLNSGQTITGRSIVMNLTDMHLKLQGNESWVKAVEAEMAINPKQGNLNVIQPGMEAFYDKILPWSMEKISKDWNTEIGKSKVEVAPERVGEFSTRRYEEVHSMKITQEMKDSVMSGQQLMQGNGRPKGAIEFMDGGKALFRALEAPDFSTMVHESFHFFRRMLTDSDITTWKEWSRIEQEGSRTWKAANSEMEIKKTKAGFEFEGRTYESLDEATRILQEEMFARGGERYFAEGIAPTPKLESIYKAFKGWMMEVYRIISGSEIDVEISPEMRNLYDRMFDADASKAFDSQIQGLEAQPGMPPRMNLSTYDPAAAAKADVMPGMEHSFKPQMKGMGNADIGVQIAQKLTQIEDLSAQVLEGKGLDKIQQQIKSLQAEIDALQGMTDTDSGPLLQNRPQRMTPELMRKIESAHDIVKNEDGSPLNLYHFAEDITWMGEPGAMFKPTDNNPHGLYYFSDIPGFVYDAGFSKPGAGMMEAYLILKNPWMPESGRVSGLKHGRAGRLTIEWAKEQGYDGAVNLADHEFVAFYPDQIINTINTKGTNNPQVLHQMGDWEKTDSGYARMLPQHTPESEANFRAFFGNSQVIDEGGQPKGVYHGTNQELVKFTEETKGMMTGAESAREGFWFTDSPDEAGQYADLAAKKMVGDQTQFDSIESMYSKMYDDAVKRNDLDAQDNIIRNWEEHNQQLSQADQGQQIYKVYLRMENPRVIDMEGNPLIMIDMAENIRQAREQGYDGVIFENIVDIIDYDKVGGPTTNYVIFEPEQAKSVYNRGTWDPDSPELYYQKSDGEVQKLKNDGEMAEPIGMKAGTYTEAATSAPPIRDMSRQTYEELVYPMLQAIEAEMLGEGALVTSKLGDTKLPPEVAKEMTKYLHKVKGQMAETKTVGIHEAEAKRAAALYNYNDRIGIDPITEAFMPYQFYYTRAGLGYARKFVNRPGLLSNYARIRNDERRGEAQPGFPQRLLGKTAMPLPFLPKWAQGEVYVDPLHNLFQFEQLPPFSFINKRAEDTQMMQRQTSYVIEGMYDQGKITLEEAQQALAEQTGPVWEQAYVQAEARVGGNKSNPMDFIELLTGFSLPLQYAASAMKGEQAESGLLPFSRLVKAATSWQKPGGVNIEAGIRKALGWPEQDQWNGIYYPIRELGNMVLDEGLDYQEAQRAMIEQSGPAWEAAVDRAGKYTAMKYFASVLWADFFPEGEEKQRALQQEFSKVMKSSDPDAVATFFDAYPEYQARMQVFNWDDPEQMMRQYMKSQIWDNYYSKSDPGRKKLREGLGEEFNMYFLNGETRNYEMISTETMIRWAQQLGGKMPTTVDQDQQLLLAPQEEEMFQQFEQDRSALWGETGELIDGLWQKYWSLPEGEQRDAFKQRFPQMQKMDDWETMYLAEHPDLISDVGPKKVKDAPRAIQEQYMKYNAERTRRFGSEIFDVQSKFFEKETDQDRKDFLSVNPKLQAYWDFRRDVLDEFPTLAPYIDSVERIGRRMDEYMPQIPPVNVTKFDDALLRALLGYYTYGHQMGSGSYKLLRKEWKAGGFEEEFDNWLDTVLKDSFEYFLATP